MRDAHVVPPRRGRRSCHTERNHAHIRRAAAACPLAITLLHLCEQKRGGQAGRGGELRNASSTKASALVSLRILRVFLSSNLVWVCGCGGHRQACSCFVQRGSRSNLSSSLGHARAMNQPRSEPQLRRQDLYIIGGLLVGFVALRFLGSRLVLKLVHFSMWVQACCTMTDMEPRPGSTLKVIVAYFLVSLSRAVRPSRKQPVRVGCHGWDHQECQAASTPQART